MATVASCDPVAVAPRRRIWICWILTLTKVPVKGVRQSYLTAQDPKNHHQPDISIANQVLPIGNISNGGKAPVCAICDESGTD
jgi:hypothetical protein